jgi:flavin reductase (DIM6/NTAB) family NADH-FMN oxidoreductase RutF
LSEYLRPAADPRALRDAFGAFLTGVTVVTAHDAAGRPVGFTANSFASLSLDPPLLLVCLARTSRNFQTLTNAGGFAVNILAEHQKDVSNTFARPVEDRFAGLDWHRGPHGSPVLGGVAAWFDCALSEVVDGGDHVILIGRVEAFENGKANGLGYARGGYFAPALAQKAVAAAGGDVTAGAVAIRRGEVLLIETEQGRYALPACRLSAGASPDRLQQHLAETLGLPAAVGFLYSVYQNSKSGEQHIVYRCELGDGEPRAGRFFSVDALPLDRLIDAATGDILKRYAVESRIGNFGMYVGSDERGQVHAIAQGATR